MAILFGDINSYLQSLVEEAESKKKKPLVIPDEFANSSKKFDLVILPPTKSELKDWRDDCATLFGTTQPGNNTGWCCMIAEYSDFFGQYNKSFDCPNFPDSFENNGGPKGTADLLYDWMLHNDCEYEMEGSMGFYSVNTKKDAINLLKQCPLVGKIHELDSQCNIIATY